MRIIQQVFLNQPLKVSFFHFFAQRGIGLVQFDMDKGLILIVQPALQCLKPIHKSLWNISEIRLPVPEFEMVDGGQQGLFVKAVSHDSGERLPDCTLEFLLPVHGGSL